MLLGKLILIYRGIKKRIIRIYRINKLINILIKQVLSSLNLTYDLIRLFLYVIIMHNTRYIIRNYVIAMYNEYFII